MQANNISAIYIWPRMYDRVFMYDRVYYQYYCHYHQQQQLRVYNSGIYVQVNGDRQKVRRRNQKQTAKLTNGDTTRAASWHASEALNDAFVWRLSVAYIGPNSRTERPRKTTIGHRGSPRHTWHYFQGQKVKSQLVCRNKCHLTNKYEDIVNFVKYTGKNWRFSTDIAVYLRNGAR